MTIQQFTEATRLMNEIVRLNKVIKDIKECKCSNDHDKGVLDETVQTLMNQQQELNRQFEAL